MPSSFDIRSSSYPNPTPLPRSFYEPSAALVAPKLLGHLLFRRTPEGEWAGGVIVETEAYLADDPACHGFRRKTPRNRSMYGPPGHAYVYFIYGNYFCFNAVCAPDRVAEAVLIRAIEPTFGEEWMRANRPVRERRERTAGPAKLCLALDIKRPHDGLDLCDVNSGLIIAHNADAKKFVHRHKPLITTTRIGISVAADLPLRFYLEQSQFVSKRSKPSGDA
ncbi:MAG TPA: DNA-3-methyladenine glycosylase [Candidatus Acidoferrum sp.]|nr:DNA-3-methyladenine glycosylase [Candidatus Acidoferrum sp.]